MIVDNGKYYIYRHIRLDKNEPFYVGIGTKKKNSTYARAKNIYKRNNLWFKITAKTKHLVEILLESDDYAFIKQKEQEFIHLYGRINNKTGILANLTDGGEGCLGYIPSKEVIQKHSIRMTGRKDSLKTIEAKRKAHKNRIFSQETKDKIREKKKGCKGHFESTLAKRVEYIPTGDLFKSISKAAKNFSLRRNSFGKDLEENKLTDFRVVSEEYYCLKLNKRNIQKERLKRLLKTGEDNAKRKTEKI